MTSCASNTSDRSRHTLTPKPMMALSDLFMLFLRNAGFALGNGYAAISPVRSGLLSRRLMTTDEFADALATAQAMPGLFGLNLAALLGFRLRGWAGAVVAVLAAVAPAFAVMVVVASCYADLRQSEHLEAFLKGVRPAVVALVALPFFQSVRHSGITTANFWLPLSALFAVWLLGVPPAIVVTGVAVAAVLYSLYIRPTD